MRFEEGSGMGVRRDANAAVPSDGEEIQCYS